MAWWLPGYPRSFRKEHIAPRTTPAMTKATIKLAAMPTRISATIVAYIRNTPNFVSSTGALSAADKASASTRRVSLGRMMPSSHSRAVA